MNEPRQITTFQTTAIVVNSTIGVTILALPRVASEKVGTGGFLVTLIAICFSLINLVVLAYLCRRFPRENIIRYSQKIVGKPVGIVLGFLLFLFFGFITSLVLREFTEVMNTTLLQATPNTTIIFLMLFLVAVATRNNVTTISYIHTYYFPLIILPILFMVIIAIKDIEVKHMKPYFGNDTTLLDFLGGGLAVAGLPFMQIGLFIITVITPHMIEPKNIVKGGIIGGLISGFIILITTGVTVAVFGAEEIDQSLWPMLVLTRMTELPASILERLDLVFLIVWIISAFTTLLSGYLIFIELGSQLFRLQTHQILSYIAFPVIFGLSLYPDDIFHLYELIDMSGKWLMSITMFYPLLLLILALIRKKGDTVNAKIQQTE